MVNQSIITLNVKKLRRFV